MKQLFTKTLALALVMLTLGGANAEASVWISMDGYTKLEYELIKTNYTAVVVSGKGVKGNVKVPPRVFYDGIVYNITGIGKDAFANVMNDGGYTLNPDITGVDLSACKELTEIGNNAFMACTAMETIKFPTSLKRIGMSAFSSCNFTEITIPSAVEYIAEYAFYYCRKLASVNFSKPDNLLTICENAFASCNIESLSLGDDMMDGKTLAILDGAFKDCMSLKKATVTGRIEKEVFKGCKFLKEVTFDAGTTKIGDNVIAGCNYISSVTYKTRNIKSGTGEAFGNFNPESEGTLMIDCDLPAWNGMSPFNGSCFKGIIVNSTTLPEGSIWNCPKLETVLIAQKVGANGLNNCTFYNCPKMSFLTNNSNFSVEDGSLYDSSKQSLIAVAGNKKKMILPATVTTIAANALDSDNLYVLDARAAKKDLTLKGIYLPPLILSSSEASKVFESKATAKTEIIVAGGKRGDLNNDDIVDGADVVTVVNIVNGAE